MDELRMERVGRNEGIFRQVNEQIEQVNLEFASLTQTMELVCECADIACTERFLMTVPAYEHLRSDSALFAVRPGHVITAVEHVVEQHPDYQVIRKDTGLPREIAAATDPRG